MSVGGAGIVVIVVVRDTMAETVMDNKVDVVAGGGTLGGGTLGGGTLGGGTLGGTDTCYSARIEGRCARVFVSLVAPTADDRRISSRP